MKTNRYEILVKMENETRASVREKLNSYAAAIAVMREYTSMLKREGYTTSGRPKPNKKMWFFRGDDVVTIHLRFSHEQIDVMRAEGRLTFYESLLN